MQCNETGDAWVNVDSVREWATYSVTKWVMTGLTRIV